MNRDGPVRPGLRSWEAAFLGWHRHPRSPFLAGFTFVISLVATAVLLAVEVDWLRDSAALRARGQVTTAVVDWVNEDAPTARVTFDSGHGRVNGLLDPLASDVRVQEQVPVIFDPQEPQLVRDARRPVWAVMDHLSTAPLLAFFALLTHVEYQWWRWLRGRVRGM